MWRRGAGLRERRRRAGAGGSIRTASRPTSARSGSTRRDGALFLATNTGLYRVGTGERTPHKLTGRLRTPEGDGAVSEALVVRFTGPDRLIGSGHPSAGSALPPVLGLMSSRDGGRSWTSVSELGRADFHTLEPAGTRLVGALFGQAQALVSADGGRTFETRIAPGVMINLVVDPADPRRWLASTDRGIFGSLDDGRTWRQRDPAPNARLAWARDGTLYRLDPGGRLRASADGGESWRSRGSTGGEPQALSADGPALHAALLDGSVQASSDGGRRWTERVAAP